MNAAALLVLLIAAPIRVQGEGDCPRAADVQQRLDRLVGGAPGGGVSREAIMSVGSTGVTVRLTEPDGMTIAEKWLSRKASCADLAATAAVVLATWETRLRSDVALPLERPGPRLEPAVTARKLDADPAGARAPSLVATGFAGLFAAAGTGSMAPALTVGGRLGRPGSALAGQVSFHAVGPSRQSFAGGQARWGRFALGAGPAWRKATEKWAFIVAMEASAGMVVADGDRYATNLASLGLDLGGIGQAAVGRRLGRTTLWVGAELAAGVRRYKLEVVGSSESQELPRVYVLIGLGCSFGGAP